MVQLWCGVPVVSRYSKNGSGSENAFNNGPDITVKHFNGLFYRIKIPGVSDHVGVGKIRDNKIKRRKPRKNSLFHPTSVHGGRFIKVRRSRRRNENALFVRKRLLDRKR